MTNPDADKLADARENIAIAVQHIGVLSRGALLSGVALAFDVPRDELLQSSKRLPAVVAARRAAMIIGIEHGLSRAHVARWLCCHHTSVLNGLKRWCSNGNQIAQARPARCATVPERPAPCSPARSDKGSGRVPSRTEREESRDGDSGASNCQRVSAVNGGRSARLWKSAELRRAPAGIEKLLTAVFYGC